MIVSKPFAIIDENDDESVEFKVIGIREKMPGSHLAYDSKFLPLFNFDIDIDTLLEAIGGLDSIQVIEKGQDIIRKIIDKKSKNIDEDIKSTMSTGEYAKKEKVHPDTVRRWIKKDKIPSTKTKGGHYRIPV